MMPIDGLAILAKFRELYAAHPDSFHVAAIALVVFFIYFAIIEIVAYKAK